MRNSSVDKIIMEVLSKEHAHLSSLQIYDEIRKLLPAVNHSTVYRSLERLSKGGVVSVSDMGTGATVYELLSEGVHHHLVCQNCGQVITISDEDVHNFFAAIQTKNQFQVITKHLVLFGLCQGCHPA